jgi:hypothetical protein
MVSVAIACRRQTRFLPMRSARKRTSSALNEPLRSISTCCCNDTKASFTNASCVPRHGRIERPLFSALHLLSKSLPQRTVGGRRRGHGYASGSRDAQVSRRPGAP